MKYSTSDNSGARLGAAAGWMLIAKMTMWNKDYEEALSALSHLEEIYGEDLSSYDYAFNASFRNHNTPEPIMEIQHNYVEGGMNYTSSVACICTPSCTMIYDEAGASLTDGSIENSILNPTYFYESYYLNSNTSTPMISDWASYTDDMSQIVWDWWCVGLSAATTTGKTIKTMWDPCPPGYKVPEADAFNALVGSKWTWDEFDVENHSHKSGDFLVPTISHRSAGVAGYGSASGNWKGETMNTPAYAWSSFPGTAASKGKVYGYRGWFRNKSCGVSETTRVYASPVRCIKDTKD